MENSFARLLDTPLFTFRVGDEQKDITIHSGPVSAHSFALDNLMNGPMMESQEKLVTLGDVSVDTFEKFSEFVYTYDYSNPTAHSWEKLGDSETEEAVKLVAAETLMPETPPEWEDPGPPPAADYSDSPSHPIKGPYRPKKFKKGKKRSTQSLIPSPYIESGGYSDWRMFQDDPQERKGLIRTAFSKRTYNFRPYNHFPRSSGQTVHVDGTLNFGPVLLSHTRVYVFADKYGIGHLKLLALSKIHAILDKYDALSINLIGIVDLVRFCFENTPHLEEGDEPLQSLVVHYLVSRYDQIKESGLFTDLLESGGPFVSLLWRAMDTALLS